MARKLYLLFMIMISGMLYAQNVWNYSWKMEQIPFQPPQTSSEMGIVKAGFDTDKDGKGEFLCAYTDMDSNYCLLYEANGDNNFELVWYFKYPVAANTYAGITVGDLDGNGMDEIITTMPSVASAENPNPTRLWVFEWNGVVGENKYGVYTNTEPEANMSWDFLTAPNIDFRPYSLQVEDIDSDGQNELIVGIRQGGRGREVIVIAVEGQVAGFGSWVTEYNLQGLTGGGMYNVTTGDLDGDGKKEIYAFVWNMFSLYIIEATGPNTYELVNSLSQLYTTDYGALDAVRVTDVNNDGVNEMYIAATEPENAVFCITNVSDVSAITPADVKLVGHLPKQAGGKLRTLYVDDPDQDGLKDLMIGGEMSGRIFDLEYSGSGSPTDSVSWNLDIAFDLFEYAGFSPDSANTLTPRLFYGCPAGDMDGDDKKEYVFVNYKTSFSVWPGDAYVWVIEADKATGVEDEVIMPETNYLAQNFPNPFNPSTTINFNVQKSENVKLTVYDMLGREVATLVNGNLTAGQHSYSFDASKLSSGMYMYQLTIGTWQQTKKMMLVK